ncbi:GntR family transcriptional regulator [Pseudalkalibacillus caeni]|uniref:GntR family transcriptional regulator n=1 Tax=Exobacillus caeni TaxID=2574798 RepID=A0A5R9EYS2_9BACL|nr:GntR family transcriptional regulator [Pseudalkalibacillus caeni]TLS35991.1 GntR family transcriptional regulator [Pseudalkalibacillus caeni]
MILNSDSMKPIYIQIAEWLETEIISENINPHQKIYSQYQLAEMFNINPATAAKGLNILADEKVLYKKRGLGMFVTDEAKETILSKRKNETLKTLVVDLVKEADYLNVSEIELIQMVKDASSCIKGDGK